MGDMLVLCIRLNLECAAICDATAEELSRAAALDDEALDAQLDACVVACAACATECERHAEMMNHCRVCAEACRACEAACQLPSVANAAPV